MKMTLVLPKILISIERDIGTRKIQLNEKKCKRVLGQNDDDSHKREKDQITQYNTIYYNIIQCNTM